MNQRSALLAAALFLAPQAARAAETAPSAGAGEANRAIETRTDARDFDAEAFAKEIQKEFGPDSEFQREMEKSLGPDSEFQREMRSSFGPDSEFQREIREAFGPDGAFQKGLQESLKSLQRDLPRIRPGGPQSKAYRDWREYRRTHPDAPEDGPAELQAVPPQQRDEALRRRFEAMQERLEAQRREIEALQERLRDMDAQIKALAPDRSGA